MNTGHGVNSGCPIIAEFVEDGGDPMLHLLLGMRGRSFPSSSGKKVYRLSRLDAGESITLSGDGRQDSILKWDAVQKVYFASDQLGLTPKRVDEILHEHPATHNSSTMCALVLAMHDSSRLRT